MLKDDKVNIAKLDKLSVIDEDEKSEISDKIDFNGKKDVDKVNIQDLISGLRVTELKALETYLNDVWKV